MRHSVVEAFRAIRTLLIPYCRNEMAVEWCLYGFCSGGYLMSNPVPGYSISTPYRKQGSHWKACGWHTGVDFAAPRGTPIVAPIAGTIRHRRYGSAFGPYQFAISPSPGQPFANDEVFFAHTLSRLPDGTEVQIGQVIAKVGDLGNVTGPHLHFEYHAGKNVWNCGVMRDPAPVVNHGGSGGGSAGGGSSSGWQFAAGTKVYGKYLKWDGHHLNDDGVSNSIKAWQEMLNKHPLSGGTTLPITGKWAEMTATETQKCQSQHLPPADSPIEAVYVGPKQFDHIKAGTGCPYVWVADENPGPGGGGSGAVQVTADIYTSKLGYGQTDSDTVKELQHKLGVTVTGNYDDATDAAVRNWQTSIGNTPDPAGKSWLGPAQAARMFPAPPYTVHDDGKPAIAGGASGGGTTTPPPPPSTGAPAAPPLLYPGAVWDPVPKNSGGYFTGLRAFTGTAKKVTLHTTETAGKPNWAAQQSGIPHLTFNPDTGQVWQHLPFTVAGYALKGGDHSPNSDAGVNIQIEIIGYAKDSPTWSEQRYSNTRALLAWLCDTLGIPFQFPFPFTGNDGYGLNGKVRQQWSVFRDSSGIVGHANVPFNCTTPDTLILCGDLKWRRAGDLKPGDEIIGFDEEPEPHYTDNRGMERKSRRYRHGKIVHNIPFIGQARRVVSPVGEVVCTPDHPWLVYGVTDEKRRHKGWIWKKTENLEPGDELAWFDDPWDAPQTRDIGWLAGMLDADGFFTINQKGQSALIGLAQRETESDAISEAARIFKEHGIDTVLSTSETSGILRKDGTRTKMVEVRVVGGQRAQARAMGVIQPSRFVRAGRHRILDGLHVKTNVTVTRVPVTSVEAVPDQPMAGIETDIHTYITGGFLTHQTHWDPGFLDVDALLSGAGPEPEPEPEPGPVPPPVTGDYVTREEFAGFTDTVGDGLRDLADRVDPDGARNHTPVSRSSGIVSRDRSTEQRWRAVLFAVFIVLVGVLVAYSNGGGVAGREWIGIGFAGVGALLFGEAFISWYRDRRSRVDR